MDRILMNKFVSERQLAAIFTRIVKTLKEIHKKGYIHRDLKLENIIFENNKPEALVEIVDFGMMVKLDKGKTEYNTILIQGTPGYLAPESILEMEYSPKTDFFAAACCFYAMLSGEMAFDPADPRAPANQPFAPMTGTAWEKISDDAKSFISFLLEPDKEKRPSADEILNHPWLSGEANDENLDTEYFSRLKSLALRQKIRGFFVDNNIWDTNRRRQITLNHVVPNFRKISTPKKCPILGTLLEDGDEKGEFEYKLQRLRAVVVKTLKPDFCFQDSGGADSPIAGAVRPPASPLLRDRGCSNASASSEADAELLELSSTFRKYVLKNGEIPYEGFIALLKCVELDEFATPDVFKIFDGAKSGSVDMKEFLLTMLAMKRTDETDSLHSEVQMPRLGSIGNSSFHGDTIQIPRRNTAIRLVDDAKLYFDMFDVKQTGYIDIDELKLVMDFMIPQEDNSNKEALNDQVEEMFHFMDKEQNGVVSLNEFNEFYKAVMVASTQLKIDPSVRRISFAKAISNVQARSNSADIEDEIARSISEEQSA
jgi:serine/threonine protein kinase